MPSHDEWKDLYLYVGEEPGITLRAKTGWNKNNNGTDTFGFNALPSGYYQGDGIFSHPQYSQAGFWCFYPPLKDYSEHTGEFDWNAITIKYDSIYVFTTGSNSNGGRIRGHSLRLVKDTE